jgi:hypothetical protein
MKYVRQYNRDANPICHTKIAEEIFMWLIPAPPIPPAMAIIEHSKIKYLFSADHLG